MLKKIIKTSFIGSILISSQLFAENTCNYTLSISNDINGNLIKASKNIGLFSKIEKENNCVLSLLEYDNHIQNVYALASKNSDGALLTSFDLNSNIGATKSLSNNLLNINNNVALLSKSGKSLKDLKNQKIYLTKQTYFEYEFANNVIKEGLNPYKDFEIINIENEKSLLQGYKEGKYSNIVLDKSKLLNVDKNKIIDFKEKSSISLISTLERIDNFEKKEIFIDNVVKELLSTLERDAGSQLNLIYNEFSKITKLDLQTSKNLIKSNNYVNSKSNLDLYNLEYDSFNFIQNNKLNKYNLPYSIFVNGKHIGTKSSNPMMTYKNILIKL